MSVHICVMEGKECVGEGGVMVVPWFVGKIVRFTTVCSGGS